MKSEENVLGKGIEAIFARTAHLKDGGAKTLELPNGMIQREGDDLIIRLTLDEEDDIRGAVEVLHEASKAGMLDALVDAEKLKQNLIKHLELAQNAYDNKDYVTSIDEYEYAIHLGGDSPEIRFNLAVVYELKGDKAKAIKQYKKVLRAAPKDVQCLSNLGRLINKSGDFSKAMDYYQKAVQYDPSLSTRGKDGALFGPRFPCRKIKTDQN